jgi:hypothetical protein
MAGSRKVRADARRSAAQSHARLLRCEHLEDRRVLAALVVSTLADTIDFLDGKTSLREAITATNILPGADKISFDLALFAAGPQTILLKQGELQIADSLTIYGPGVALLTIDARGNDPTPDTVAGDGSRVVRVDDGDAARVSSTTLVGITFTGGDTTGNGAGIFSRENLTLDECDVWRNYYFSRFGPCSTNGGGGIYLAGSRLELNGCRIRENDIFNGFGGGVALYDGSGTFRGTEFSRNGLLSANVFHGGVYTENCSDLDVEDCRFVLNSGAYAVGLAANAVRVRVVRSARAATVG